MKQKENLYEWEDALELLKPSEISINGISDDVFSAIKMSFTYLETEDLKSTFLLCSIMGHDAIIEDLVKHCRGLALFPRLDTIEKGMFPELNELKIDGMENLKWLWSDRLDEHSFSKLTSIELGGCPKLLHVFPLSMLTRLERLESLSIYNLASVEEIISESQEKGSSSSPQFIHFRCLTSLYLWGLPKLKSVHHKMHTIDWPSLKEMALGECDKVEILFASASGETSGNIQPLFWVNESTFPKLHQLSLGWNAGMKESIGHCNGQQQHQQFVSHYFPNLKVVQLISYHEEKTMLPSYLFPFLSLPTIQTLGISHSCFKELIFPSEEGGEEKHARPLLSQITELWLHSLKELMHLQIEKEGLKNLKILNVRFCPKLEINLVPSSVSFRNLETLTVWECDGIIKLITHSTAKSLVHLKEMSIRSCRNIEEIIQGGDNANDDEIIFPQLNSLKLGNLPKLQSFCSSEKYTFGFPSLQIVCVHECPAMKMFSQGDSKTPKLHKVQLHARREEHWRWEGSLNNTIQKVFREREKLKGLENLIECTQHF